MTDSSVKENVRVFKVGKSLRVVLQLPYFMVVTLIPTFSLEPIFKLLLLPHKAGVVALIYVNAFMEKNAD